ncbi:MAG: diguanylate cyclase [Bacteroidota bacterium]|nr:diguanylate cyclase [Bacteroidota bacterium]
MNKPEESEELKCDTSIGSVDDKCEDKLQAANIEIEKLDNELEIAHNEITHQEEEIELQASELVAAYKELKLQNNVMEIRGQELLIANKELQFQIQEKEERAKELFVANLELMFQNDEKELKRMELTNSNLELLRMDKHLKGHIRALEEMMFMISHKVRQPVANILGLANLFDLIKNPSDETKKLVGYNRESALALDLFTQELTIFIGDLKRVDKNC